jgi:hypothetical protein
MEWGVGYSCAFCNLKLFDQAKITLFVFSNLFNVPHTFMASIGLGETKCNKFLIHWPSKEEEI